MPCDPASPWKREYQASRGPFRQLLSFLARPAADAFSRCGSNVVSAPLQRVLRGGDFLLSTPIGIGGEVKYWDATHNWRSSWPLRSRRSVGSGRDGRGLSCVGYEVRPRCGDQGAALAPDGERPSPRSV